MLLYMDLDGVICDFLRAAVALWDMTPEGIVASGKTLKWHIHEMVGCTQEDAYKRLESEGSDFWRNVPAYPWAETLWGMANQLGDVKVLSSPMNGPSGGACVAGKIDWLKKWTGDVNFHRYIITSYKADMAAPGRVLVDDKDSNCDAFRAAGGTAILFPQHWNRASQFAGDKAYQMVIDKLHQIASGGR